MNNNENPVRKCFTFSFLIIGVLFLGIFQLMASPDWKKVLVGQAGHLFWCIGWSAVGIGLGLWNSIKNDDDLSKDCKHYITYFLFVWFIAVLASWIPLLAEVITWKLYAVSAIAAIVVGFSGDNLAGKISDLFGKSKT